LTYILVILDGEKASHEDSYVIGKQIKNGLKKMSILPRILKIKSIDSELEPKRKNN